MSIAGNCCTIILGQQYRTNPDAGMPMPDGDEKQ